MKKLFLLLLLSPIILWAQYQPMSIYRQIPAGDTCTVKVIPPNCYFDSVTIEGFITGGEPPLYYTWKYLSNNTIVQDSTPCTIVPGYDFPAPFDNLDHLNVSLNLPQPRLSNSTNWTGQWRLTVLDSHVESATDKHDTLVVNIKHKFPDQIILPNPLASVPSCDTCYGDYLWIIPQRGTPPYNILLMGQDNLGNNVEHYGYQCNSLHITNLAELGWGCYDIYVQDKMGCQEVFNYCYTTTSVEELSTTKHLLYITDVLGRPCLSETGKILLYHYSDGSIVKTFKVQ